jgi:hypothetical protein
LARFFVGSLLEPVGNDPGVYGYWYAGTDIMHCFAVLVTFWSLVLFSGIEVKDLIETGFDYVLQKDNLAYFRKRK